MNKWKRYAQELETESQIERDRLRGELERWQNGVERMLGGVNICSKLHGHTTAERRDPGCPICCPVLSELVAGHVASALAAAREREATKE